MHRGIFTPPHLIYSSQQVRQVANGSVEATEAQRGEVTGPE